MTGWKTAWRSFYYAGAPEAPDPVLVKGKVALLVIDVQNTYLARPEDRASLPPMEQAREAAWDGFHERMHGTVIPTIARLIERFRADGNPVLFARIACLTPDGRDRSLSQKKPGWNNLFLPHDSEASQVVPALAPRHGEVVVTKTTDSALTGTNLRLILANMGITHVVCTGIFTDQCVSSTVRWDDGVAPAGDRDPQPHLLRGDARRGPARLPARLTGRAAGAGSRPWKRSRPSPQRSAPATA